MNWLQASFATILFGCSQVSLAATIELPKSLKNIWTNELKAQDVSTAAKTWIKLVVDETDVETLRQWHSISSSIPERLKALADTTYVINAINAGLYQTSFDKLIALLSDSRYASSSEWAAIEPTLLILYPELMEQHHISIQKDQEESLGKLAWQGLAGDLKSFAASRQGTDPAEALQHGSRPLPWSYRLALNNGLRQARAGMLDDAIKTITNAYQEAGSNDKAKNPLALTLGRLYFQKGDLKLAEEWFGKTQAKSKEGVTANEELMWVWLRQGQTDKLRGTAAMLELAELSGTFMPESLVVRAISDLKLCQYDNAKKDFAAFVAVNTEWAKQIDQAAKQENVPAPPNLDANGKFILEAITARNLELGRIKDIAPETAEQKYNWDGVSKTLESHVKHLTTLQTAAYRRQWHNNAVLLQEAIRKMQFVKLEMASLADAGTKAHPNSEKSQAEAANAASAIDKASEHGWTFPLGDDEWADERLAARSTGSSVCL